MKYSVKQWSELAGVTQRTLHHDDGLHFKANFDQLDRPGKLFKKKQFRSIVTSWSLLFRVRQSGYFLNENAKKFRSS